MRIRSFVLLLSFAVLPSQGQEQQSVSPLVSGALRKSGLPGDSESVTIPLKSTFAGYTVEVEIEGQPAQLILDTGAASTVLTRQATERLGLKAKKYDEEVLIDITGTKLMVQRAVTKRIRLGKAWTENEPVMISKLPAGACDGLLGISTLADWDVRINPMRRHSRCFPAGKRSRLMGKQCFG